MLSQSLPPLLSFQRHLLFLRSHFTCHLFQVPRRVLPTFHPIQLHLVVLHASFILLQNLLMFSCQICQALQHTQRPPLLLGIVGQSCLVPCQQLALCHFGCSRAFVHCSGLQFFRRSPDALHGGLGCLPRQLEPALVELLSLALKDLHLQLRFAERLLRAEPEVRRVQLRGALLGVFSCFRKLSGLLFGNCRDLFHCILTGLETGHFGRHWRHSREKRVIGGSREGLQEPILGAFRRMQPQDDPRDPRAQVEWSHPVA
mmetsp:Transcript_15787/g.34836  ORF Transcript_15787/g.34836 Transcript_15787/m.34836 type:complete len:258 (+) Transcript_15787:48-821(+)